MPDPGPKAPQNPVGQILTHEGRSLALVDLGRRASDALRAVWRETGKHPHESGGVVESAWLLPTLGGAGMASSSLLAGNVFLATANPATLMMIGTGVGSAVMGPAGIVAQAPFVAGQRRPDAGRGAADAVCDRLGGRDRRAPRPGAAEPRPALRCRGPVAARPGGPGLRPLRDGGEPAGRSGVRVCATSALRGRRRRDARAGPTEHDGVAGPVRAVGGRTRHVGERRAERGRRPQPVLPRHHPRPPGRRAPGVLDASGGLRPRGAPPVAARTEDRAMRRPLPQGSRRRPGGGLPTAGSGRSTPESGGSGWRNCRPSFAVAWRGSRTPPSSA